jgi:hypothetical protein
LLPAAALVAVAASSLLPSPVAAADSATPPAPPLKAMVAERLGYPADARLLIIHADDLAGMHSINRATFEALEKQWISSASIMVPCPWFPEVVRFAREHPEADLGIHLTLNSEWTGYRWGPVSSPTLVPSLLDADGYLPLIEEFVARRANPAEVERELRAQIERATDAGIRITHLDSHMATLFWTPDFFEVYARLGRSYGVPVLVAHADRTPPLEGSRSSPSILVDRILSIDVGVAPEAWLQAYKDMLAPLPPGVYQLIVHLGHDDAESQGATWDHPNWGAAWRQADYDLVRSAQFQEFLREQRFVIVGWRELSRALPESYGAARDNL